MTLCQRNHFGLKMLSLQWRHNELDGVSDHQPHDCLLNRLFRRRSKKTSKLRVTGLCAGNSPGNGEFSAQMASNAENVSIWWRHHGYHHFDQQCTLQCHIPVCKNYRLRFKLHHTSDRMMLTTRDDVIKWKHFPRFWPFLRGIHRSLVNSPHIGQWHGALMFSMICAWINDWVNNREAGDLRRHHAHYDVIVMKGNNLFFISTHWGLVMHICFGELGHHWIR